MTVLSGLMYCMPGRVADCQANVDLNKYIYIHKCVYINLNCVCVCVSLLSIKK